jgi:glutamate dehydrogenase
MTHSALDELLSYTHEHAGTTSTHLASFVAAYFDNTDPDELQTRGPANLFAIANAHWRLLDAMRSPHTTKVRVFNPTLAEDGFV